MHASAYRTANQFIELYAKKLQSGTILEVGSRLAADGQRTLRSLCPSHLDYFGVDLEAGINVDLVMIEPYSIPLADASVEVVICTSVLEHSQFFWQLFSEMLRVLKPCGLLYVNAPSNGYVHRYPVDCWRFYPDSGLALAAWGKHKGYEVVLLESFVTDQDLAENAEEIWNDFVAVFGRGIETAVTFPLRMLDGRTDYVNATRFGQLEPFKANRFPGQSNEEVTRWSRLQSAVTGKVNLYQIAYSQTTWDSVPTGFLPLDNRTNERPDWAEYWPIRRFLLAEKLDEDAFYGFISPRFSEKTFFPPEALLEFILSVGDDVQVAAFSPFFDIRAVFRNVFEQAEFTHPGMLDLCQKVLEEVLPSVDLRQLVNTSMNAIFCNYFAAKPAFWRQWLSLCEHVYQMAETPQHPLAPMLNSSTAHRGMPLKVFIIERIASLLLATTEGFKVEKFGKSTRSSGFDQFPYVLFSTLDTLKCQSISGQPMLLDAFDHIQREIMASDGIRQERESVLGDDQNITRNQVPSLGYEDWGNLRRCLSPQPESFGLRWIMKRLIR